MFAMNEDRIISESNIWAQIQIPTDPAPDLDSSCLEVEKVKASNDKDLQGAK